METKRRRRKKVKRFLVKGKQTTTIIFALVTIAADLKRKLILFSVKIIDDDIDLSKLHQIADEDLEVYAIGEDAPTIVGVVDDRPPELIAKEDYKNNGKWKVIADDDGFTSSLNVQHTDREGNVSRSAGNDSIKKAKRYEDNDDLSPPRVKRRKNDGERVDAEPKRTHETVKRNEKHRTSRFADASPPPRRRRKSSSSDKSPPRKHTDTNSKASTSLSERKIKVEPDSDASPPRRRNLSRSRGHSDPDQLPPRIKGSSATSPSSRRKVKQEPDSDASPPRRPNRFERSDSDQSPPRKSKIKQERSVSPTRRRTSPRRKRSRSPRRSPANRRDYSGRYDKSNRNSHSVSNRDRRNSKSPFNRRRSPNRDTSPKPYQRKDRKSSTEPVNTKLMKTLDGKAAGLQDAKALRIENDIFKKREEEMFNKMSADVLGKNAEAVVRDRKTGRIRDLGEEAAKEHEKLVKEQERKKLYDKWGKG